MIEMHQDHVVTASRNGMVEGNRANGLGMRMLQSLRTGSPAPLESGQEEHGLARMLDWRREPVDPPAVRPTSTTWRIFSGASRRSRRVSR